MIVLHCSSSLSLNQYDTDGIETLRLVGRRSEALRDIYPLCCPTCKESYYYYNYYYLNFVSRKLHPWHIPWSWRHVLRTVGGYVTIHALSLQDRCGAGEGGARGMEGCGGVVTGGRAAIALVFHHFVDVVKAVPGKVLHGEAPDPVLGLVVEQRAAFAILQLAPELLHHLLIHSVPTRGAKNELDAHVCLRPKRQRINTKKRTT